jgi:hypothetical protein
MPRNRTKILFLPKRIVIVTVLEPLQKPFEARITSGECVVRSKTCGPTVFGIGTRLCVVIVWFHNIDNLC